MKKSFQLIICRNPFSFRGLDPQNPSTQGSPLAHQGSPLAPGPPPLLRSFSMLFRPISDGC